MTDHQVSMFSPQQRSELNEFIARQLSPRSYSSIMATLSTYSDTDLMNVMTVSNLHPVSQGTPSIVAGFVSGDELPTIRIVAEHAESIRAARMTINHFHLLLRTMEKMGIMPRDSESFPALKQHIEVSEYDHLASKRYSDNESLILFVQENLDHHVEIMEYMENNGTTDVAFLRAHFCGESASLNEGTL